MSPADSPSFEEALRLKTEELDRYFMSSLDLLCIADMHGYFRRINPEWHRTLGYLEDELVGRQCFDLIHPADLHATHEAIARLRAGHPVVNLVNRYHHKDGSWRWIEWRWYPSGELIYSVGRDVTERRQAEELLRESHLRFEAAFNATPMAVVLTKASDSTFVDVNPANEQIFGWKKEELLGRTAADVKLWVHPEDRVVLMQDLQRLGRVDQREVLFRHKDGRVIHVSISVRPVVILAEPHLMFFAADLTDRKRAEENMLKAEKLESIGVLAGGIAHDFNNLLAGIFGNIDLAQMELEAGNLAVAREHLDKSMGVLDRARELTRQLLTFSKGGAPNKRPGDVGDLVRDHVRFALSGSNVKTDITISRDLWPCDYDRQQIAQVVDSMVINAKQAMPDGGELRVQVENADIDASSTTGLCPGPYVRITFTDLGVGIMREHLAKVFDPFFSTKQTGGGLGLATSWSIVKRHGGHIDVSSIPGHGATFSVYLPAASRATVTPHPDSGGSQACEGVVLIMDDEPDVRDVAGRLLSALGYTVLLSSNGHEAIRHVEQAKQNGRPVEAAILDLTIPGGMGGKEVVRRISEIDEGVRSIASSGYADDPVMSDPSAFGFVASLSKPYRRREAADLLAAVLATRNRPSRPRSR